jgi:hypothetical protein
VGFLTDLNVASWSLIIGQEAFQSRFLTFLGVRVVKQFVIKIEAEQKRIKVKCKLVTVYVFSQITNLYGRPGYSAEDI